MVRPPGLHPIPDPPIERRRVMTESNVDELRRLAASGNATAPTS
jgi:hypothetical protein